MTKQDDNQGKQAENWQDRWDFDQQATSYDRVTGQRQGGSDHYNPHENYQQVLEFVARQVENHCRIADLGTGTGNLAQLLLKNGHQVVGVDQSARMLEKAREKLSEIRFVQGNILDLPFEPAEFDAIVSTYALHHLSEAEKQQAWTEMIRVTGPNGAIVVGDNMFYDAADKKKQQQMLLDNGQEQVWKEIEEEYLGQAQQMMEFMEKQGLTARCKQLAPYTWVVKAQKK